MAHRRDQATDEEIRRFEWTRGDVITRIDLSEEMTRERRYPIVIVKWPKK